MNPNDHHGQISGQHLNNYPSANPLSSEVQSRSNADLAHHHADPVLADIRAQIGRASAPTASHQSQGIQQALTTHEDPVLAEIRAKIAMHEAAQPDNATNFNRSNPLDNSVQPSAEDHKDPVLAEIRAKMAQMIQRPTDPSHHALETFDLHQPLTASGISPSHQKIPSPQPSRHRSLESSSRIQSVVPKSSSHQEPTNKDANKPHLTPPSESELEIPEEVEDLASIAKADLRPLPSPSTAPAKSILKKAPAFGQESNQQRRLSVQDQTNFNALINKVDNLEEVLASTDHGLIDTSLDAHKKIVENVARRVLEDPPRYALRALYQEFLPCLRKINKHYHKIAVGTSAEHPSLKDCDARLKYAEELHAKMNDLI